MARIVRRKVSTVPAWILGYQPPTCDLCGTAIMPASPFSIDRGVVSPSGGTAHFWCLADHAYEAARV